MPIDKYFFGTNGDDRGATALYGTDSSNFVDHIHGLGGSDELFGYAGTDFMYGGGGGGGDLIAGGTGVDLMQRGAGFDVLSYAGSGAGVNVNLLTGAASGGEANADTFSQMEAIRG